MMAPEEEETKFSAVMGLDVSQAAQIPKDIQKILLETTSLTSLSLGIKPVLRAPTSTPPEICLEESPKPVPKSQIIGELGPHQSQNWDLLVQIHKIETSLQNLKIPQKLIFLGSGPVHPVHLDHSWVHSVKKLAKYRPGGQLLHFDDVQLIIN